MSNKHVTGRDSKTGQFTEVHKGRDSSHRGVYRESGRFTIGAEGMEKLNAVEGIELSQSSRKMFAEFERTGASAEERRRAIVARHARTE